MSTTKLTRKERQIMDLLFTALPMTVEQVRTGIDDGSSYSSTRASLTRLVEKGLIQHKRSGVRYLFSPVEDVRSASRHAVQRVMDIFFGGSPLATIDAVLNFSGDALSAEELDKINELLRTIEREEGAGE